MFAGIEDVALVNATPVPLLGAISGKRFRYLGCSLTVTTGSTPQTVASEKFTIKAGTTVIDEFTQLNQAYVSLSQHGHPCGVGESVTLTPSGIPGGQSPRLSGRVEYEIV